MPGASFGKNLVEKKLQHFLNRYNPETAGSRVELTLQPFDQGYLHDHWLENGADRLVGRIGVCAISLASSPCIYSPAHGLYQFYESYDGAFGEAGQGDRRPEGDGSGPGSVDPAIYGGVVVVYLHSGRRLAAHS